MQIPREAMAIRQVAERLAEILNASSPIENIQVPVRTDDGHMWDAVFTVRGLSFVAEWKRSGSLGHVTSAIRKLETGRHSFPHETNSASGRPLHGNSRAGVLCAS